MSRNSISALPNEIYFLERKHYRVFKKFDFQTSEYNLDEKSEFSFSSLQSEMLIPDSQSNPKNLFP